METRDNLPILYLESYDAWLIWLSENYTSEGAWVKLAKKGSGQITLSYVEAREGALRYGWIDGLINKYDESFYLTRFTPRRPRSIWSKENREIVEDLETRGLLFPSGLAQLEMARADGRLNNAYDAPSKMTIPPDFQAALDKHPAAKSFFATITKANRYALLWRIHTVSPKKRAEKIAKFIEMLEAGEVFHPKA